MNRTLLVAASLALAGCPDNQSGNPAVLWMAPDQNETHVMLVDAKPHSY